MDEFAAGSAGKKAQNWDLDRSLIDDIVKASFSRFMPKINVAEGSTAVDIKPTYS